MDLTKEEILEKHYKNHAKRIAFPENVYSAMKEFAAQEAKAYASWLSNQVIAGRTAHKLWLDYQAEFGEPVKNG